MFNLKRFLKISRHKFISTSILKLSQTIHQDIKNWVESNIGSTNPPMPPNEFREGSFKNYFDMIVRQTAERYARNQGKSNDDVIRYVNDVINYFDTNGASEIPDISKPEPVETATPGIEVPQEGERVEDIGEPEEFGLEDFQSSPQLFAYQENHQDKIDRYRSIARNKIYGAGFDRRYDVGKILEEAVEGGIEYALGTPKRRRTKAGPGAENIDQRVNFFRRNYQYLNDNAELIKGLANVEGFPMSNFPIDGLAAASKGRPAKGTLRGNVYDYLMQYKDSYLLPKLQQLIKQTDEQGNVVGNQDVDDWVSYHIENVGVKKAINKWFTEKAIEQPDKSTGVSEEGDVFEKSKEEVSQEHTGDISDIEKKKTQLVGKGKLDKEELEYIQNMVNAALERDWEEPITSLWERLIQGQKEKAIENFIQGNTKEGMGYFNLAEKIKVYYQSFLDNFKGIKASTPRRATRKRGGEEWTEYIIDLKKPKEKNPKEYVNLGKMVFTPQDLKEMQGQYKTEFNPFTGERQEIKDTIISNWMPDFKSMSSAKSLIDSIKKWLEKKEKIKEIYPKQEKIPTNIKELQELQNKAQIIKDRAGEKLSDVDLDFIMLTLLQDESYIEKEYRKRIPTEETEEKEKGRGMQYTFLRGENFIPAAIAEALSHTDFSKFDPKAMRAIMDFMKYKELVTEPSKGKLYRLFYPNKETGRSRFIDYYYAIKEPITESVIRKIISARRDLNRQIINTVLKGGQVPSQKKIVPFTDEFINQILELNNKLGYRLDDSIFNEIKKYNNEIGALDDPKLKKYIKKSAESVVDLFTTSYAIDYMIKTAFYRTVDKIISIKSVYDKAKRLKVSSNIDKNDYLEPLRKFKQLIYDLTGERY